MSLTKFGIQAFEYIGDTVNEGILSFHVESNSFDNRLVYINKIGEKKIDCVDETTKETMTIEQLFGMDRERVQQFVREKLMGKKLQEEKMLYLPNNRSGIFLVSYHVLTVKDGFILQVFLTNTSQEDYVEDLIRAEYFIENVEFNEGYIALLLIKNYHSIVELYGQAVIKSISDIIIREMTEEFKGFVDVGTTEQSYLIVVTGKQEDVLVKFRNAVSSAHKAIFEKGINVLCDIKMGVSSYCSNPYTGLHEAKFSLHNIYSESGEVADYIVPNDEALMEFVIKNDLPYAIKNGEMSVVFQGIFNIQESFLYGFEVLVRWHHNKYGSISPAQFIPVAENNDYITEIDLWVVEQALKQFDRLELPGKSDLKINFNISPRDFFEPDFVDEFIALIENSSVECKNVILELTETLNLTPKKSSLQKIKDKGILIALDDFGTGFSSLSQIKNYKIDFLKIDISFVRDINKNYDNTLITNAILALADNLNVGVIAEGVDNDEQLSFLKSRRCGYVQGYKFHKPMEVGELYKLPDLDVFGRNETAPKDLDYKKYVATYEYGKLVYLSVSKEGVITNNSDLLGKILEYEVGEGDRVQSIVIDEFAETFVDRLTEVVESGVQRSFMTELVGLKESVPVKATIMPDEEGSLIDVFIEDYREKRDKYTRTKNIYNRYDLIFRKVNTAIIVYDTNMKIQEWNYQAEVTFKHTKKEVVGKNLIKLLFDGDAQDTMDVIINKTLSGEETEIINEVVNPDGEVITCHWRNIKLANEEGDILGVISWVMDITEKCRVENELNALSTVIRQEPSLVMLTNTSGKIEYINDAFTHLTGFEPEEVIGHYPSMLSSGAHSKEFYKEMWDTILAGEAWEGELRNKKKNGDLFTTATRIFPIKNEKGSVHHFSCIQKDISQDIAKDSLVQEINETLESQERLSMIGQMAAGIMHEINNPLSFIDINVHALPGMLDDIEKTDKNKEVIEELYDLGMDLKDGIDSIKEIAAGLKRFTYKSQSNEFEDVDINEEIKTIAAISKNEYKYYSELEIDAGQVDMVLGDAGKIKQVLLNLIINAVHAIREKGDDFGGRIKIRTYQENGQVCCDVTDNGNGIPEEIKSKIFESFYTTKKNGKGTGLGLSLSKKIIETEHKGTLTFESKEGVGTTFSIKLNKRT